MGNGFLCLCRVFIQALIILLKLDIHLHTMIVTKEAARRFGHYYLPTALVPWGKISPTSENAELRVGPNKTGEFSGRGGQLVS